MFLFIKDLINKIKTDDDNQKENIKSNPSDIEETDKQIFEEEFNNREEEESVEKEKESTENIKRGKKKKNKKEKKKKARKKLVKPIGIAVLCLFMVFCISRVLVLTSTKEFLFDGRIYYNASAQAYQISYEIENLWNGGNFQVGEKVCVPDYLTSDDALIREKYTDCVEGKIIEAGNKVKIQYDLPKYVSYDEFKLYVDKDNLNKNFSKIYIKMKVYGDLKQIVEISPRK